jgi:hypothetical protein
MTLENIRQWEGSEVVDPDQSRIGKLQDVYFDAETDEPLFVTVHTGLLGRHLTFVPTEKASLGQGYLQVARYKAEVSNAPQIEPGGDLTPDEEERVFKYYGLEYERAATESGRRLVRR